MATFGELFKNLRLELGLSLRSYCQAHDEDPAYISRLERGKVHAPKDEAKLEYYAKTLQLKPDTKAWKNFFELAGVSNKTILDTINNPLLLSKLPLFLRTLDNKNLDEEKLNKILEIIKKS
jgi:transcriptional regulator with XRE-family HTH domain